MMMTKKRRRLALPAALAAVAMLATPALADDLIGTAGNDVLNGTPSQDTLAGLDGDDQLNGESGQDDVSGGPGNDTVDGGVGQDDVVGGPGADTVRGGDGQDDVSGGPGNDTVDGGVGQDDVVGGPGADTVRGGDGQDDVIGFGDGVADILEGGPGNDTAYAGPEDTVAADVETVITNQPPPCYLVVRPEDAVPCATPPDGLVTEITDTTIRGFAGDYDFVGPITVHIYRGAQFLGEVTANETATYPADERTVTVTDGFTFVHNQGTTEGLTAYAIDYDAAGPTGGAGPTGVPNPVLAFDTTPFISEGVTVSGIDLLPLLPLSPPS